MRLVVHYVGLKQSSDMLTYSVGRDMSRSSPTLVPKGQAHTNAPPQYKQRE